jgi:hypothetical protein
MTMITKMDLIKGELGRFAMIKGEDPIETCNRLKTLGTKSRTTEAQDGWLTTSCD